MRGQTVAPGASDLLIIAFDAFGQVEVNDEAHIGLVDAHAKRDGGNDDLCIIADEGFLIPAPFRIIQSRMIWADSVTL